MTPKTDTGMECPITSIDELPSAREVTTRLPAPAQRFIHRTLEGLVPVLRVPGEVVCGNKLTLLVHPSARTVGVVNTPKSQACAIAGIYGCGGNFSSLLGLVAQIGFVAATARYVKLGYFYRHAEARKLVEPM
jgi:hypothetical protein